LSSQERLEEIVRAVSNSVNMYDGHGSLGDEDYLFVAHTQCFVDFFAGHDLRGLKEVWTNELEPLVKAREAQIGKPIHKGAALHNTGLLFFADGDCDSALAYLAEAGKEDERAGRRKWHDVLTGLHPLTQTVLTQPLERDLFPTWAAGYFRITGRSLDSAELTDLLKSLADRPTDAIQAITALHRIRRSLNGPQNGGTSVVRVRAVADLLHLIESRLRGFQTGVKGQLHAHLTELLTNNVTAQAAFGMFKRDFESRWPQADREQAVASVRLRAAAGHRAPTASPGYFSSTLE
jgi:hypothetical protein